jgi:hypothetical protein
MRKVYSFNGSISTFVPEYYHAFGKVINSRRQIQEEISRVAGDTGKELVEVGNDRSVPKPHRPEPDLKSATKELKQLWQK